MATRRIITKQLGELLIERGLIAPQQLQIALAIQKEKGGLIGEILVDLGFVKEEDVAQALTTQYGFPFLPLANYEINPEVIGLIPLRVVRQYLVLPIDRIANSLTVTMSNPLNAQAIEDVEMLTKCSIQTFVSTSSDIKRAIDKYYKEE